MLKETRIYNGVFLISGAGAVKTGQLQVKEWNQKTPNIYKNKLKMDQRPKCKINYYKAPKGKHRENILWQKLHQYIFGSLS